MQISRFKRKQEDFVCEHCGVHVVGNGYTNHCPNCLWSKHVDVNPGDRASECKGMMKPVGADGTTNNYSILNKCIVCGYEKRNKCAKDDNMDVFFAIIAEKIAEQSRR